MNKLITKYGVIIGLGVFVGVVVLFPDVSYAATDNLKKLINLVIEYLNYFIYLIIGLATLSFVWNVYRLYFVADADRSEAGQYVLYSVIGFFVMLSMWGLVNLVAGTFKLDNTGPVQPFGSGSVSNPFQQGSTPTTGVQFQGSTPTTGAQFQGSTPTTGAQQQGSTPTQGFIQAGSTGTTGYDDPQEND